MRKQTDQTLKRALSRIADNLPFEFSPSLAAHVNWTGNSNMPVHRWFRYREGFSPSILSICSSARSILDPFCGCGSVLLQSGLEGRKAFGVDVNPLAVFVSTVKVNQYTQQDFKDFDQHAARIIRSQKNTRPFPIPKFSLLDKIFLPDILNRLMRMRSHIEAIREEPVRNLLLLCWLNILESCSNVFKEGNGLKYRNKKRSPGKYQTIPLRTWTRRYFGVDHETFIESKWNAQCDMVRQDLPILITKMKRTPQVYEGSCLQMSELGIPNNIDAVVFSPPYANRFDYFEAFKMELWMGGFVQNSKDLLALRKKSIRNNLAASRTHSTDPFDELDPFLRVMDENASSVQMGIKNTLRGYFADHRQLFQKLHSHLRRKGQMIIVVGNSAYASSIIPTDALLARLAASCGFKIKRLLIARPLHVSSQQRSTLREFSRYMRESVLIFERI